MDINAHLPCDEILQLEHQHQIQQQELNLQCQQQELHLQYQQEELNLQCQQQELQHQTKQQEQQKFLKLQKMQLMQQELLGIHQLQDLQQQQQQPEQQPEQQKEQKQHEKQQEQEITDSPGVKELKMSHVIHFLVASEREEYYGNTNANMEGDYVMICIDGSKRGDDLISWYFKYLHREGNRVMLLHAIQDPVRLFSKEQSSANKEIQSNKIDDMHKKFKEKFAYKQCDGSFYSSHSKAADLILKISLERSISYIVIGTKVTSRFKRAATGTVTENLMKFSRCPIIVGR